MKTEAQIRQRIQLLILLREQLIEVSNGTFSNEIALAPLNAGINWLEWVLAEESK